MTCPLPLHNPLRQKDGTYKCKGVTAMSDKPEQKQAQKEDPKPKKHWFKKLMDSVGTAIGEAKFGG